MWSDENCAYWQERVADIYGLKADITGLDGEFDLNAAVSVDGVFHGVLKVMRPGCETGFVDMQIAALDHLAAQDAGLPVPRPILRQDGAAHGLVADQDGAERRVWMLSALPGHPLGKMRPHTPALMHEIGSALGAMTVAFQGFAHPQLDRPFKWHPMTPHWAFDALDQMAADDIHGDDEEDKNINTIIKHYFQYFKTNCESEIS